MFLAIAIIITHVLASPTSSAVESCSTAFDATVRNVTDEKSATSHRFEYDNITFPVGSSANVPMPYLDLNYIGWTVAALIDIAQSSPNTIYFNGSDDTGIHSLSVR